MGTLPSACGAVMATDKELKWSNTAWFQLYGSCEVTASPASAVPASAPVLAPTSDQVEPSLDSNPEIRWPSRTSFSQTGLEEMFPLEDELNAPVLERKSNRLNPPPRTPINP